MRTSPVLRALLALLACVSLIAAACGGSDDDDGTAADIVADAIDSEDQADESNTGDDSTSSADTETGDAPADDAESDGSPEGDEDAPEEEPAADDSSLALSGDAALFCARYAENSGLFRDVVVTDPDSIENWINTSQGLLSEAIGAAPAELVSDLQTIQDGVAELAALLEAYGFDFLAVSDEEFAATESPEFDAASDRIDAWLAANCPEVLEDAGVGVEPGDVDADAIEAVLGSEAGRQLVIDQFVAAGLTEADATCVLDNLGDFDISVLAGLADDPTAITSEQITDLLGLFATCGIDVTQFLG